MLSCGRVIGRLPKLAGHSRANHFYRPLKYVGIISVNKSLSSSYSTNKKSYKTPGTTIKPEECVPETCQKPDESRKQANDKGSEFRRGGDKKLPPYWKLLASLIVAGVTIYATTSTNWFSSKDSQKDVSKKKKKSSSTKREKRKVPATSTLIPREVPYLLIGGGTAAFSAFRSIKSRDPKAKVLVITEEEDFPYMRPPLSKELWYNKDRQTSEQLLFNQWNGTQRSIFYEPQEFYSHVDNLIESDKGGVAIATGWKVTKVDVTNKTVTLEDGYEIKYDKCLIATGASPKNLPVFQSVQEKVKEKIQTFRTKQDFLSLEESLHNEKCKNLVIIGGGFLGSELACSLARNFGKEKKVFQVYKEKFIMGQILPEYLSEWATKKATSEGVGCIPSSEVEDLSYKNGQLSLCLTGNRTIDADQVIVAVGVEPNTDLATSSYLETDSEVGGFVVNAELEARSDLWVAGDAACFYDIRLGRRRVEHHDHAVVSGRLAGENMTGAGKPYSHQSMFWSDLGPEVGYEAIGIVDSSLPTVGVFATGASLNQSGVSQSFTENKPMEPETAVKPELADRAIRNSETLTKDDDKSICEQTNSTEEQKKNDDFGKGVVFYLRDDIVVGIVLWNIFNRMSVARQVLARGTKYDDLNEVAKLFTIHDE